MLLLVSAGVRAQDLIVKSDGDEIKAKVISVEESKVTYRKWSNKTGPTYTIGTDKIFMIKYMNGEKDVFGGTASSNKPASSSGIADGTVATGYVEKQPAANNASLISKYNPHVEFNLKQKDSKSKWGVPVMGVEPSSILSNEDVEVNFVRKVVSSQYNAVVLRYYIEITNKTNGVIYVDKGNSFRNIDNISTPFYDTKVVSVSSGSGSGAGLGLGAVAGALGVGGTIGQLASGVSVGGGSSSSVSTTYSQQRILAIPPHSSAYISEHTWDNYKGNKWKQISEAEYFEMNELKGGSIRKGEALEFSVENSPRKYKYFITYSPSPDFETYSFVTANLYVKYLIGESMIPFAGYEFDMNAYTKERGLMKHYNEVIPNFEAKPSMIVGRASRIK